MFCHKCGTEIAEGAEFCHKCGTKVATLETEQSMPREAISEPLPVEQNAQPEMIPAAIASDDSAMFKAYVDNHVRATTKYQSAEELLKKGKPQMLFWICYSIPAIIGLVSGGPLGALGLGLFLGITASWIAGGIVRNSYIVKTIGKFKGSIDTSDLLRFLNVHLSYLHPYFNVGNQKAGVLSIPFGIKQRSSAIIRVIYDTEGVAADSWKYVFDAQNNPSIFARIMQASVLSRFTIIAGLEDIIRAVYHPKHTCLFKTVPILQAAMEYYLKYYANNQGGNENGLH